ncbi:hypothetical protein GCK72_000531 [Caenorhabditis remanei]|uniref:Uncharacterized protein n=1 Tax=Caenorhabditis remanei TaxID=31234 RepID=A0A6A5HLF1_CAERE|nr:hypothetical protein GCK72_000531 [Caenorhabditis remanei]KAF1768718.1 hypothetical protein GCK72_000531 [Caenorhabditis remanei]
MELIDILFLSFCSKKLKKSIESSIQSRLDKIISITYCSSKPANISISSSNSNNKDFMKLVPREEGRNRPIVQMNLFGVDVDCCMATRNHPFFILCNQQDIEQMLQTIHNYFRQFFGSSIEYHLEHGSFNNVPRLENIRNSILYLSNEEAAAQLLDEYLTLSPSQEHIRLYGHRGFEYENNLKLAQAKVLDIMTFGSRVGGLLKNFTGRQLFISGAILTDDDVIQFLNSWKSSQTLQNLEYLTIYRETGIFQDLGIDLNPEKIRRNVDVKRFDPNQKMPIFRYDRRRIGLYKCESWQIEEFSSPHFIVRDADQHVASLEITTRGIQFASWKMTEEEVMRGRIQKTFQRTPVQEVSPPRDSIKISKFSWLIQREILSSMELSDLLMIASCSQKFHQYMKSLMRSRFDKILTITYDSRAPSPINISSSSSGDLPFMSINRDHDFRGRPLIPMNLVGMDLQVSMPTRNHPLMVLTDLDQEETLVTSIHDYFLDFFGSSIKYQLNVDFLMSPFSKLKNITCTYLSSYLAADFPDFLKISPNQDFIGLSELGRPSLGRNLEFARTKVLDIGESYGFTEDILSNFEGRQLFIDNGIISDAAIIQFLNKWRSSEGYQNLEYLTISVSPFEHPLNPNEIMNSIPIHRLYSSDKLPVYQVAKKDHYRKRTWGIHKFSSPNYIVRDSDQNVASIMITEDNITFAAWNVTEKEFLEKLPVKRFY